MPGLDPTIAPWVQLGATGLVIAALLTGLLVTKGHADEIRAGRKEAMDGWRAQTEATKEVTGVVREQAGVISELKTQVAELLRREAAPGRRGS